MIRMHCSLPVVVLVLYARCGISLDLHLQAAAMVSGHQQRQAQALPAGGISSASMLRASEAPERRGCKEGRSDTLAQLSSGGEMQGTASTLQTERKALRHTECKALVS